MNRSSLAGFAASVALGSTLVLSGCALGTSAFPDTPEAESTSVRGAMGTIAGSNFGGHAPIVGAHVFLLQGATNGYYAASTSLLASGETATDYYGSVYTTQLDATGSGSPTNGFYYITTDARGDFNLSNGYSCTPGLPVYIYAQGGNPETNPTTGFTVSVTNEAIAGAGPYTLTFTTTGNQLLYQGESVTLSGFSGSWAYLNATSATVLASSSLTTTTFQVSVTTNNSNATGSYTNTGTATQATPIVSNPAVLNLAVLGICPSNGTANFSYLPFVYMNEVSTAAAAYALGGFFPSPGASGLANAGAVAANLSIPASNAQALLGLQNAALTAGQLYDILGSNLGAGADGETHISRTTTPGVPVYATTTAGSATVAVGTTIGLQVGVTITGPTLPAGEKIASLGTNSITLTTGTGVMAGSSPRFFAGAGSGTVPQTLLNTIGNILANCVDSANTYNAFTATGTATTQCTTLFGLAKSGGTSGITPIDTASVAIDIAHNPWANVTSLVGSPTGNAPFQPILSAANDLAVGIAYTPAHISNPEGMAIDAKGNIWYPNANGLGAGGYVTTLTPFGAVLYNSAYIPTQVPHYIAIDGNGTAWYGDGNNGALVGISSAGSLQGAYLFSGVAISHPYAVVSDGLFNTGYIYVEDLTTGGMDYFNGAGVTQAAVPQMTTCMGGQHADHATFDNANDGQNLWSSSQVGGFVCKPFRTASSTYTSTSYAKYTLSPASSPNAVAVDYAGIAYIPANGTDEVVKVAPNAADGTTPTVLTGATLSSPFGVAVDGQGHIFVSNRTGNNISEFVTTGAVSAVNYTGAGTTAGTLFSDPLNMGVDPSGALWVTNYGGSRIVELLGVAVPTATPLSLAANNNKLGARP